MTDLLNPSCARLLQLAVHHPAAVGPALLSQDPDALFHDRDLSDALARLLGGWTVVRTADASTSPEVKRRLTWLVSMPWCGAHLMGEACDCVVDPAEVRGLVADVGAWFVSVEGDAA